MHCLINEKYLSFICADIVYLGCITVSSFSELQRLIKKGAIKKGIANNCLSIYLALL